jgi:hypothetical protein
MALNDLQFSTHRRAPWGVALFFVIAVACLVIGLVTRAPNALIFAILPATLGIALWLTRPGDLDGSVTEQGIALVHPPILIPFSQVRQVDGEFDPNESMPPSFKILVHHTWGVFDIPIASDINSAAILSALMKRFVPTGSRDVNPYLRDYMWQHEANFGPDRVWSFRAHVNRGKNIHRRRPWLAAFQASLITGILWIVVSAIVTGGAEPVDNPWIGVGALLSFMSLFGIVLTMLSGERLQNSGIRNWKSSSLVITPVGLALIQGDVQGELLWDQLRDVKYRPPRKLRMSGYSPLRGITLVVDGTKILIADLYDRPISLIHDRILRYWRPEGIRDPNEA